ncbi:ESPR-type extended signal peptide-containing protein [uncultured Acinetobacter sp.]|uniref:ESPR-type extended signal peptide-containing protein n=1 Tax=uncultured Acinetobacter sp. TaxID=165433 RepID=UPI0026219A9A|nr:ESPR-type extended signal peptide-containing protein [uncultured Acinetobacter sp.]
MNKVFKTVWNASLGVWVAVSETASSQKKGSNKLKKAAANAVATVVVGTAAVASTGAIAYDNGYGTTTGTGTIAIGSVQGNATAKGNNTTALGTSASASGQGATAIGATSKASGQNSTAIGQTSQADNGSTAIGGLAKAYGASSTAMGTKAEAHGDNSIALGSSNKAEGTNSIAIGASATGDYAIAVGGAASERGAVIVGTGSVSGKNSAAVGYDNTITQENTFILGTGITNEMANSVLLGAHSELSLVHLEEDVKMANYTYKDVDGKIQVAKNDITSEGFEFSGMTPDNSVGAVSVGAVGAERQIQNVGAGRIESNSTDAVNGSQLYYVLSKAQQALYDANLPINFIDGDGNKATVNLGDTFNIKGAELATDGAGNHTLTVDAAAAAAWNLTAKDANALPTAPSKTTEITGKNNTVEFVGSNNAVVSQTELKDTAGNVIGTQVNVEVADQINLSKDGGLTIAGVPELDPATGAPLVDPITGLPVYEAGKAPITINQGNVSFGGNQLHDVAAGQDDTDAVNVSQLKDALDTLGGGATVNADGSINAPSYTVGAGNTIVNTVGAAIDVLNQGFTLTSSNATGTAAGEQIQAGDTIDITVTKENNNLVAKQDGSTIEFALADKINLSKDGGLTIAGVPELDPITGAPLLDPITGLPVYEAGKAPITINQGNVSFGGNQLHDVAAGQDDTDAVNVSQLKDALDTLGGGATVNADGSINAPSYTVGAGNTIVNTVGAAIDVLNQGFTLTSSNATGTAAGEQIQAGDTIDITVTKENNNLVAKQDGSTIEFALADKINLSKDGGLTIAGVPELDPTTGAPLVDPITGLPVYEAGKAPITINQGNVSFGGNVLQNVGAGVNATDAVNVSQLQSAGWNIIAQDKGTGNLTENAVNGDKDANTSAVQFNGDNNISVSQKSEVLANGDTKTTIEVELEKDIDLSAAGSLKIGDTLVNNAGLTLAGATVGSNVYGPIVINQGNVSFGGNRLQNVATGVDGTDAVNVDQLKDEIGKAVSDSGWTLTTAGDSTTAEKIKPNDTVDFSGDKNITVSNKDGDVTIALNPQVDLTKDGSLTIGDTVVNNDGLTVAGNGVAQLDAAGNVVRDQDGNVVYATGKGDITVEQDNVSLGGNQINDVARADQDHQAVNLGQLKDELGGLETTINNNINEAGWSLGNAVVLDANGNPVLDANGNPVTTAKINPNDQVEHKAGSNNVTVGTTVQKVQLTDANGQPVVDAAGEPVMIDKATVTVDLADQITLTGDNGSLTIGAGKGNNAITIEQDNISVGGNQIHNLAAGTDGKDAVNVDQLKGAVNIFGGGAAVNPDGSIKAPTYNINGGSYDKVGDALGALNQADIDLGDRVTNLQQSFNNRIDDVEDRMSAGIASAMALETAPYVPGKYTYAAATAYHNGQAALGITLRKTADNGRWSLTGGVATGTEGDPSVRLGVSGIID